MLQTWQSHYTWVLTCSISRKHDLSMNAMQPNPSMQSYTLLLWQVPSIAFVFVILSCIKPFSKYTSNNCKTREQKQLYTNLLTFLPLCKLELVEISKIKNPVEFCSKSIKDCSNYFLVWSVSQCLSSEMWGAASHCMKSCETKVPT